MSTRTLDIVQRIIQAADNGDYPIVLSLWDYYILNKLAYLFADNNNNDNELNELLNMECLLNLYVSTYPFRLSTLQMAKSAKVCANLGARGMAIFKNYLESRKQYLINEKIDNMEYRHIHKIAFPPTHPKYKHLFTKKWIQTSRDQLIDYLTITIENNQTQNDHGSKFS